MAAIEETKTNVLFSQGDSAKIQELKDEFNRLVAAINALDARVADLEAEEPG
jgi:hypothetical protein